MTLTPTPTHEQLSRTQVGVARSAHGGRAVVSMSALGPPDRPVISPMLLSADDKGARVSLVPQGALLLAGDAVSIEVTVGPGAHLELVEPGGTVAYAMDGGWASWQVRINLASMSTLIWAGEPFVVAHGSDVDRRTSITLGWGARLALRETLVLGRHGERAGTLRQELNVSGPNDVPVLNENLDIGPSSSRLVLGGSRVVASVLMLGRRLPQSGEGTHLDLEAEGTMIRALAADAHLANPVRAWAEARRLVR